MITKWKENRNPNIQMIGEEEHEKQPKIVVVMRRGTRTRVDVIDQGNMINQWVKRVVEPQPLFNHIKEKEMYTQVRKEVMGVEWIKSNSTMPILYGRPPIYGMPPFYDHS
jgi:hypothetical protein